MTEDDGDCPSRVTRSIVELGSRASLSVGGGGSVVGPELIFDIMSSSSGLFFSVGRGSRVMSSLASLYSVRKEVTSSGSGNVNMSVGDVANRSMSASSAL